MTSTPAAPALKIWPLVGLAAFRSGHGGAWRAWVLARSLDPNGSSQVKAAELRSLVTSLGKTTRTARRWLRDAVNLGIMHEGGGSYYLAGLGSVAVAVGCKQVGKPATIQAAALVKAGWRAHVWAAFLATSNQLPISQRTKKRITGITCRTQRNYQRRVKSTVRKNYVPRGKIEAGKNGENARTVVKGWREAKHLTVFTRKGQLIQRLPDIRTVPSNVSATCPKGRSKKAQRLVNSLFSLERGNDDACKLFYSTDDGARGALRAINNLPWEERPDVFELKKAGTRCNTWEAVYDVA